MQLLQSPEALSRLSELAVESSPLDELRDAKNRGALGVSMLEKGASPVHHFVPQWGTLQPLYQEPHESNLHSGD